MNITQIDFSILNFIQEHLRCAFLDGFMPFITKLGNAGFIWIVISVIFICIPKYRRVGLTLGITLALSFVCYELILKNVIARPRPFVQNPAFVLLIKAPSGFSFPSGHTTSAFCAATILFCFKNKLRVPILVLAILIAFSRLYLYVHFPTDVLAGIIIGILFGIIGFIVSNKIVRKN